MNVTLNVIAFSEVDKIGGRELATTLSERSGSACIQPCRGRTDRQGQVPDGSAGLRGNEIRLPYFSCGSSERIFPEREDWTESYQALYHEHMLEMWSRRPYIWAMHVWNMFDFGADGRDEGGKPGQNQKGLVTFDRKTKKDAFYIYKAYLHKVYGYPTGMVQGLFLFWFSASAPGYCITILLQCRSRTGR